MATKEKQSPKVANANRHAKRGSKPGDKVVNRSKKSKPLPRIKQGETLLDDMSRNSRPARVYTTATAQPKQLSFVEKQLERAQQLFAQNTANKGTARRLGGDTLFEQYKDAKPVFEGSKKIRSKTSVAKQNAYAALSEMSPAFRAQDNQVKAFKAGIQDAVECLIAAGHTVRSEEA